MDGVIDFFKTFKDEATFGHRLNLIRYRHQPSQSRVDIEHWLKANTA